MDDHLSATDLIQQIQQMNAVGISVTFYEKGKHDPDDSLTVKASQQEYSMMAIVKATDEDALAVELLNRLREMKDKISRTMAACER